MINADYRLHLLQSPIDIHWAKGYPPYDIGLYPIASKQVKLEDCVMEPTLKDGDRILVNKVIKGARLFDVFAVLKNDILKIEGLSYQMYDATDYQHYLDNYLRAHYGWALADIGKPGLDKSKAVSVSLPAQTIRQEVRKEKKGIRTVSELVFPERPEVDRRVYPEKMYVDVLEYKNGKKAEVTLTIKDKPAVRLPEAYWLSFNTDDILSIVAEKVGERVDLFDVVEKGNRQQHGIDRYVDLVTSSGTIRIWSEAAFLVNVGEARGINYSLEYPDKKGGIHFNLSNNLWNTNFRMWNEGSLTYRFTIERIN